MSRTERGHLRSLINTVSWAIMEIREDMLLPQGKVRDDKLRASLSVLERHNRIAQKFAFTIKKKKGEAT